MVNVDRAQQSHADVDWLDSVAVGDGHVDHRDRLAAELVAAAGVDGP